VKNSVKLDLEKSQSENTSSEELFALWGRSKSIKVRKAIASNPNADSRVLKQAARLYLEEVVDNPGFKMLYLFNDGDPWIENVSQAFEDPTAYLNKYNVYTLLNNPASDHCLRAILLSDNLTAPAMSLVLEHISSTSLKRVLKGPKIKSKIRDILFKKESSYEMLFAFPSILTLNLHGVISDEETNFIFRKYSLGSCHTKKSLYKRFVKNIFSKYKVASTNSQKQEIVSLFSKFVLLSRAYSAHWIKSCGLSSEELLEWGGELFTSALSSAYKITNTKTLIQDNFIIMEAFTLKYFRAKFFKDTVTPEAIENCYKLASDFGLVGENFCSEGFRIYSENFIPALKECSIETKKFFIKAGALGNWTGTQDLRYKIAEEVNNYIYEKEGVTSNLVFNSCSRRKIITFNSSTHVY
jgi:hypothetical protein